MPIFNPITKGAGSSDCPTTAKRKKTGQIVSRHSNDDGDTQRGRLEDFFRVRNNLIECVVEKFGHNFRFTGITGGYQDPDTLQWKDKNGNTTTEALAFPNDIVIDWSQCDKSSGDVIGFLLDMSISQRTQTQAIDYCKNLIFDGKSDWFLPNDSEFSALRYFGSILHCFDYGKFSSYTINGFWTSTSPQISYGMALVRTRYSMEHFLIGNNLGFIPARIYNISEL